ncbi:uncharacterized protein TNCV_787011 [Trichonephila clavipes]|nr:uncharacterized protein TNCV_787011 [Trichonephila clavipes]
MGPLVRLDTTLTVGIYVSILSDHIHSLISFVHSDGLEEIHPDNAKPYTSRIATKRLQLHSSEFRHFRLPPKSQDMNSIDISEMP